MVSNLYRLAIAAILVGHAGAAGASAVKTDIYTFPKQQNGPYPQGAVIFGAGGSLLGVADTHNGDVAVNDLVFQLTPPATPGGQWTYADIYDFPRGGQEAGSGYEQQAIGPLAADSGFTLYGVTEAGGPISRGSIYRLIPPKAGQTRWTNQELYGFKYGADGGYPNPVALAGDVVYGATSVGGGIFRLAPPGPGQVGWQFTMLHSFALTENTMGTPLVRIVNGVLTLFGVVSEGGGALAVYQLAAPTPPATAWTYTIVYTDVNGGYASFTLIADRSLNLYGIDGKDVFRLAPPKQPGTAWTFSKLHIFGGPGDALNPYSALAQYGGRLYGISLDSYTGTQFCNTCGTVFQVTPRDAGGQSLPWNESILYQWPSGTIPSGAVTVDPSDPSAASLFVPLGTGIVRLTP